MRLGISGILERADKPRSPRRERHCEDSVKARVAHNVMVNCPTNIARNQNGQDTVTDNGANPQGGRTPLHSRHRTCLCRHQDLDGARGEILTAERTVGSQSGAPDSRAANFLRRLLALLPPRPPRAAASERAGTLKRCYALVLSPSWPSRRRARGRRRGIHRSARRNRDRW